MKQKKIGKKLNLNKKTIAALNLREIKTAYGGDVTNDVTCSVDPRMCCKYCENTNPSCPHTQDPSVTVPPGCPCCI